MDFAIMSRTETKFRLMRELGSVLDPIQRLLFNDAEPNPSRPRIAVVLAQYERDKDAWLHRVHDFCTINGMILEPYYRNIHNPIHQISIILREYATRLEIMKESFLVVRSSVESALIDVPTDDPDVMMPPESPFQTYLRLLGICGTAKTELELFDPYLDAEVFDRYLTDVGTGVEVVLVTEENNMRIARRRDRIIAISELVVFERPDSYRLLEVPSIHDRHLRADHKIYHLGGSAKDASKTDFYSIIETDSNRTLHSTLDGIIAGSTPWYQPGMSFHRRWCSTCKQPSDVHQNRHCSVCGTPT